MKKLAILILIMCCCLLSSCNNGNDVSAQEGGVGVNEEVVFRGVVSDFEVDLNDTTRTYTNFVVDEELALEIGKAVLKNLLGERAFTETYFIVSEIADKDFYVVSLASKVPGMRYNVALNKPDGKILKIWAD